MFYWLIKFILGPVIRFIWVSKAEGLENIPKEGGAIIAANHCSYLDFFVVPAVCRRRIFYLAAEKFFRRPLWAALMRLTGQIRVDRTAEDKKDVYEKVFAVLKQGRLLGIFPEGTRSADGRLQKAFPGTARFAITAKVPVVPVGIIGTYGIWPRKGRLP